MNQQSNIIWLLMVALSFVGCEKYFGEKTDLSFIDKPVFQNRFIAYVPIQPVIEGFVRPTDVLTGWDELIYVVDEGAETVYSYDISGRRLSSISIPGVSKIAQDRNFDLLAIGTFDTTVVVNNTSTDYTLSCVYRVDPKESVPYGLSGASVKRVVTHPFYFQNQNLASEEETEVHFKDIAVLADNSYFLVKDGPQELGFKPTASDQGVLLVRYTSDSDSLETDYVESQISISTASGLNSEYIRSPLSIVTLAQPPQRPSVSTKQDFIYTSFAPNEPIRTRYIEYIEALEGPGSYEFKELESSDTTLAESFLYDPYRFEEPASIALSGDGTNYIFIVDAQKDSLYQFTITGLEGIQPPPSLNEKKHILASFGGTGTSLGQFSEPRGVAYKDNIVYVADAGNGRVLRFKLTSDFD